MRAGPLSNSKIIALLNRSFVPVYAVNEDYAPKGPAPAEEKAERERIFKEGYEHHWSVGTVHVYVLRPDGHLFGTLHVAEAAHGENLLALLEKAVGELQQLRASRSCRQRHNRAGRRARKIPSPCTWSRVRWTAVVRGATSPSRIGLS